MIISSIDRTGTLFSKTASICATSTVFYLMRLKASRSKSTLILMCSSRMIIDLFIPTWAFTQNSAKSSPRVSTVFMKNTAASL